MPLEIQGSRLFVYSRLYTGKQWDIQHNILDDHVLFLCYDTDFNMMLPQSVKKIDISNMVVTFPVSVTGYGIVFKITDILVGYRAYALNTNHVSFMHSFRTTNYIVQTWDLDGYMVIPKSVHKQQMNVDISFDEDNFYGYSDIVRGITAPKQYEDSPNWVMKHRLPQYREHIVAEANDPTGMTMLPEQIKISTTTDVEMSWDDKQVTGELLAIVHGYRI